MYPGTPEQRHPLIGRQRVLLWFLWGGLGLAAILALGGVVLSGDVGEASAVGTVVVLVALPILRVLWLLVRWIRRGDPRFAVVAGLVLVVLAVAAVAALNAV